MELVKDVQDQLLAGGASGLGDGVAEQDEGQVPMVHQWVGGCKMQI